MYRGLVLPSWPRFDRSSRGEGERPSTWSVYRAPRIRPPMINASTPPNSKPSASGTNSRRQSLQSTTARLEARSAARWPMANHAPRLVTTPSR